MQTSSTGPDPARLHAIPLFSTLSLDECTQLASRTQERDYAPGQHLMDQGDGGFSFSVIESGTADVFVDDALVRSVGPGDVLGELAVTGAGQRTATVIASSPIQLFAFFGLELHSLEAQHPELAAKIRQVMAERQA